MELSLGGIRPTEFTNETETQMDKRDGTNHRDKIEALRLRRAALDAALAEEIGKQQKAEAKNLKREFATVGEALVKYSRENADFKLMLTQVLRTAITDDSTRKFLRGRGWAI
jgi:hypothetical protein